MGIKTVGRFVNTSTQTYTATGNILFTNNTISTDAISYDGAGGIQLKAPGLYMIYTNFTGTTTSATSDVVVSMYEGSTAVSGAYASGTGTTSGDDVNLAFNAVTTVSPGPSSSYATLYFKCAGANAISLANVIVEKIA